MIPEIQPGTLINSRYLIQKILGQGGFGRTYLAFDTHRFGDVCVLKEFVPATSKEEILRKSRELFEREAKVLYQIEHPQVPKFLAWLTENQRLFIVQEYIDGKTYSEILYERISGGGKPFSEIEVKVWLLKILPVLEFIHDRNIIHRDISLENIMLPNHNSQPVLIDFGVVKEKFTQIFSPNSPNHHYSTVSGSVVGKIGYSPPEQLRLGQCYPSSDIYALGVCAIVLLTGKMPYMLMDDSLNWQWRLYVNVSDSFANILEKMLADVPGDRYQSAKELIIRLNNTLNIVSSGITISHSPQTTQLNSSQTPQKQQAIENSNLEKLLLLEQLQQKVKQETQTTSLQAQAPVSLNREFLDYCQRELTSFVGPCAGVLMKHTLKKKPQIALTEFVEAITAAIPDSQKAKEFRNRIQISLENSLEKSETSQQSQGAIGNYPAISNPEFLENCRRELNSFVGPFGTVILKHALNDYPHLTKEELVEALMAEIPNQKKAELFRKRLLKLHMNS